MNKKGREEFRQTSKWKKFRAFAKDYYGRRDYITHEPLQRDWNLHHLDLNMERYSDLSDIKHFVPLNKDIHKAVHAIHKYWKKDPEVLDRFIAILEKMKELKK